MKRHALSAAGVMAVLLAVPAAVQAGGELQTSTAWADQDFGSTYTPPLSARPPGPQPYRFCLPYPYTGPGTCTYTPPSGMTHYAPGGWVYPGYAYAGCGARGLGPGPRLTGAIVGITLGAIIF